MTAPQPTKGYFIGDTPEVEVFGTKWCAATQMVRRYLDRIGVGYLYHDIDLEPPAADQVRWWSGGNTSHPTVRIAGQILVEPSTSEIEWALRQHGWRYNP